MTARRRFARVFLALAPFCVAGCLPDRVVWLPDSSGFIFTAGADRTKIVHYDLGKRASRVIADLPFQQTITPGLSPDGKQIALVRIERTRDRQTAQILVVGFGGETIHQSNVIRFGDGSKDLKQPELRRGAVEWSPHGDHLLFVDPDGRLGAYNIRNKTSRFFSVVHGNMVPLFFDRVIAGDGSGFLAERLPAVQPQQVSTQVQFEKIEVSAPQAPPPNSRVVVLKAREQPAQSENAKANPDDPFQGLVFVDWEGRVHDLERPATTLAALTQLSREENSAKVKSSFTPMTSWEGPVAVIPILSGTVRIDCARHAILFEKTAALAEEFERTRREQISEASQLAGSEHIVQFRSTGRTTEGGQAIMAIEIFNPRNGKRQVLVENALRPNMFLSADRRMATIRYILKDQTRDRILVVGDKGQRISDFEVE